MTQFAIQVSENPPLSGLALVQQTNRALQTIATDFSGATDPASLAGPFMTWADTANNLLKRRNAAGTAWVELGGLFDRALQLASSTEIGQGNATKAISTAGMMNWFSQNSSIANGTMTMPSGRIVKCGVASGGGNVQAFFPVAFPTACRAIVACPLASASGAEQFTVSLREVTAASFTVSNRLVTSSVATVTSAFYYIAIGD